MTNTLARLKELCALPVATIADNQHLALVAEIAHEQTTAVTAYQKIVELTPEKDRMLPRVSYATALLNAGQDKRLINEMGPIVEGVKEKDRPKRIPAPLMTSIGRHTST